MSGQNGQLAIWPMCRWTHRQGLHRICRSSYDVPAISLSALEPVSYDWLFCCAGFSDFGLGVPGACLGVPVLSFESGLIRLRSGFSPLTSGLKTLSGAPLGSVRM